MELLKSRNFDSSVYFLIEKNVILLALAQIIKKYKMAPNSYLKEGQLLWKIDEISGCATWKMNAPCVLFCTLCVCVCMLPGLFWIKFLRVSNITHNTSDNRVLTDSIFVTGVFTGHHLYPSGLQLYGFLHCRDKKKRGVIWLIINHSPLNFNCCTSFPTPLFFTPRVPFVTFHQCVIIPFYDQCHI